jgi:hypothetical protein
VVELVAGARRTGVVRGGGSSAVFIEFDGFVVGVTAPGVPLMPNGLELENGAAGSLALAAGSWLRPGTAAEIMSGSVTAGGQSISWSFRLTHVWNALLRVKADAAALHRRGGLILAGCGVQPTVDPAELAARVAALLDDVDAEALTLLLRSLRTRNSELAGTAAQRLIGRGPGLTPLGDDVVTAVAGIVAGVARAVGWSDDERHRWLASIRGLPLRVATTALSATLIELALQGQVIEPMHRLLAIGPNSAQPWRHALRALDRVGSSTGKAYGVATGAAALMCTA